MKTLSIQDLFKTILFLLLMLFPFFCIGIFAQTSMASQYDAVLKQQAEEKGPGVAALVAKDGKVIYRNAFGLASMELHTPLNPEHIFRLGSITKQITAVAILKLQEEGKLSVKDPLTKFLPEYPTQGHEILIEHLLTHTSGIKSMTNMPSFFANARKDMTPQEVVDFFKNEPMEFAPGEAYNYNNSGYFLLGFIIEKITGKSYASYIEEELFKPLGMTNSHYDSYEKIIPNRSAGYQNRDGNYINAPYLSTTLPYAAGSLLSNVDDLLLWNEAINKYKILNKASVEQAFTPYVLNNGEAISYGYGWDTDKLQGSTIIEHGGSIFGYQTQGIYLPKEDIYVIAMANCNCIDPTTTAYKLAGISIGKPYADQAIKLEEAQLKEYTGVFEIKEGEERIITLEKGQLYSTRTGQKTFEIHPYGADQFFFQNSLSTIRFERDGAGKVSAMAMRNRSGEEVPAYRIAKSKVEEKLLDEKVLKEYVGVYEIMENFTVEFSIEDGWLVGKPQDDSKEKLYPKGKDEFEVKAVGATIRFRRENDKVIGLTFTQGTQSMEGKKI